jgi:hypothetical protein
MFPQKYLNDIETDLKRACWFYGRSESGRLIRYAGARRGNRTYAAQTQKRINASIDELCKMDGTLFFITLTTPYRDNEKSILESWEITKKQWSVFLQWTRRNGFNAYIMSYEAFKNGGCHIHSIINYKDKLDVDTGGMVVRCRLNKKNTPRHFIDNEKLIQHINRRIKKSWKIGTVKIKLTDDENVENAVRYACKGIGWGSQIEDALRNAQKGKATVDGEKKLWAHYISMKLNYRRWSTSRNLKPPLDSIMSNSIKNNNKLTSTEKDDIIDYVIIPSSAIKSGKIKLEWGIVESGSDENKLANDLFEKKNQKNTDIDLMAMEALNINTPISFS